MNDRTCPPCNQNCAQGRTCPARARVTFELMVDGIPVQRDYTVAQDRLTEHLAALSIMRRHGTVRNVIAHPTLDTTTN